MCHASQPGNQPTIGLYSCRESISIMESSRSQQSAYNCSVVKDFQKFSSIVSNRSSFKCSDSSHISWVLTEIDVFSLTLSDPSNDYWCWIVYMLYCVSPFPYLSTYASPFPFMSVLKYHCLAALFAIGSHWCMCVPTCIHQCSLLLGHLLASSYKG